MTIIIHLAGNSGAGKSTICKQLLNDFKIPSIDTDEIQDQVIKKHPGLLKKDDWDSINDFCLKKVKKWISSLKSKKEDYGVICGIAFGQKSHPGLYSDYQFFLDVPMEDLYRRKSLRVIHDIVENQHKLENLFQSTKSKNLGTIGDKIFYNLGIKGTDIPSWNEFKEREEGFKFSYVERQQYNLITAQDFLNLFRNNSLKTSTSSIKTPKPSNQASKQLIVFHITGPSGCGKSTLGRVLKEEHGMEMLDTDDFLFAENGDREKATKELDTAIEKALKLKRENIVVVGTTLMPSHHKFNIVGFVIRCDALTVWKQFNKRMLDDIVRQEKDLQDFFDKQTIDSNPEEIEKSLEFTFGLRGTRFPKPFPFKGELKDTDFNFLQGIAPFNYSIMDFDEIVEKVLKLRDRDISGFAEVMPSDENDDDDEIEVEFDVLFKE